MTTLTERESVIDRLNRRWFADCRRWGIVPPLDERGEPTQPMGTSERAEVLENEPSTSAAR